MSDIEQAPGAEAAPAPDTSAPAETAAPQAPEVDFGPLMERFERIESRLPEPQPEGEPEPEADPYEGLSELGYSEEETAATRQVLEQIFGSQVQQAVGPLQQEIQRLRSELDYGDLEEKYPALATEEGAEKVMGESRQAAADIARQLGLPAQQAQQLAMSPRLMEFVHLAQIGRERAAQEKPAGQPGAELEQPGGASPPEPEPDVNEGILGVNGSSDFWGWNG